MRPHYLTSPMRIDLKLHSTGSPRRFSDLRQYSWLRARAPRVTVRLDFRISAMPDTTQPRAAEAAKMRGFIDKTGISRADIDALLPRFYAAVRAEPTLGPIFEGRIGTDDKVWRRHIAKIGDFWSNVMLHTRTYQGNPMRVHMGIPEIRPAHFEIWLDLFEATARDMLPAGKANAFNSLARRIGASLSMGIAQMEAGPVPFLGDH